MICNICNFTKNSNNLSDICENCLLRTRHRILKKIIDIDFFKDKIVCANYATTEELKYIITNYKKLYNFDIRPISICNFQTNVCDMNIFENEQFDIFYSVYVLNHVKDNIKALEEIRRVLKKNGILLLMTFLHKNNHTPTTIRETHNTYGIENYDKYNIGDYNIYNINEYINILKQFFEVEIYSSIDNFTDSLIEDYVFICKKII
jgi:SAM-dependent methyltransferase